METPPPAPPAAPAPRSLWPVLLAVAGFVLVGAAYWALAVGFFYPDAAKMSRLGTGLGVVGLACHVAAVGLSLRAWRRGGGLPRLALVYALLGAAGLAWWALGRQREARWYRENPGVYSSEFAGDGIDVRDGRGMWHVAFSECPGGPTDGRGTRGHSGVLEVVGADGAAFMRLHIAERRVECLTEGAVR